MPIQEKRLNAIHQLTAVSTSIREIATLPSNAATDAKQTIHLLIQNIQKDSRVTLGFTTNSDPNAVPKEQALDIEKAYDIVSSQCEILIKNISAFYLLNDTSMKEWTAYVVTPLALLEQSVKAAISAGKNTPTHLVPTFDKPINISNAVLLIRTLAFKIVESKSIGNEDVEGMLRVSGNKVIALQAIENIQIACGLKAAPPAQRPRALSTLMWKPAGTEATQEAASTLINIRGVEAALSIASGHDFTSIMKEIMLNLRLIGLEQPTLNVELKSNLLVIAQSLEKDYKSSCDRLMTENTTQGVKLEKEEINQLGLAAIVKEETFAEQAQNALNTLLTALPAYYVDMLSSLLDMMHAISHPELNNKMNAANVGLALPGIFEMIGLCDTLPQECTPSQIKTFEENKKSLAVLTSFWVQDYANTQKTFSTVLTQKHQNGDVSDTVYQPNEIEALKVAARQAGATSALKVKSTNK